MLLPLRALCATTGQLAGSVTDAQTERPLPDARVTVAAPSGTYQASTDAKGVFSIAGIAPDTYVVSIEKRGFDPYSVAGVTVTTDETFRLTVALHRSLTTIASTRTTSRSITSAYQPQQTVDRYTVNSNGIAQLLGKTFNTDQKVLLRELPSVTIDKNGTPLIRGGFAFQTAFQFEGIDYTVPNRSVASRFENAGNSNVLNGVGSLEIIPGGGDATHGNTGTGLIALTAKRGTYPAFGTLDTEVGAHNIAHQVGFEYGTASKSQRLSNYFSFVSEREYYQYGAYGVNAGSLGAAAITDDPSQNSNVNAHSGSLYTSAFYNPWRQSLTDAMDNVVWKFGKQNRQSLQLFMHAQSVRRDLDYGGFLALHPIDPAVIASRVDLLPTFKNIFGSTNYPDPAAMDAYLAQPRGTAGGRFPLLTPEFSQSPFKAVKLEYQNALTPSAALGIRVYRTSSNQLEDLRSQGVYVPRNGGTRNGISADLTEALGDNHALQIGAKYEYAHPYGEREDVVDYLAAYDGTRGDVFNLNFLQNNLSSAGDVVPDFVVPPAGHPTGCNGPDFDPTFGRIVSFNSSGPVTVPFQCGYLTRFFPNGVPALPAEREVPTADQQNYALYAQDTWSPNLRLKLLLGLRLDGYNFLLPDDPLSGPAISGIKHQRLYEPHFGISWRVTDRDALRMNYGRTLAIPLPTFLGLDIDRTAFSAFAGIPSFDNRTGGPATYCGPGSVHFDPVINGNVISGTEPCKDYADQLYWLMRNYRFGNQSQFSYPLRGATFTNYDLSYSHEFRGGAAFKITPFFRRGYDIVETTRTLLGYDPVSGAALFSPEAYSNLGLQKATGVEFDFTSPQKLVGWSAQVTATYINQFGNDPPGNFLPTASLQLGNLYHSPSIAPFQATIAGTYRAKTGLKFNPILTIRSGYPYGNGVFQATSIGGVSYYIPITDALYQSSQTGILVPAFVNPQNPGTITSPVISATRGVDGIFSGPGELRSAWQATADLTIEFAAPRSQFTYGLALRNIFTNIADIPVANYTRDCQPVYTGLCASTPGAGTGSGDPTHTFPPTTASGYFGPYVSFANQEPFTVRFYVQMKL